MSMTKPSKSRILIILYWFHLPYSCYRGHWVEIDCIYWYFIHRKTSTLQVGPHRKYCYWHKLSRKRISEENYNGPCRMCEKRRYQRHSTLLRLKKCRLLWKAWFWKSSNLMQCLYMIIIISFIIQVNLTVLYDGLHLFISMWSYINQDS